MKKSSDSSITQYGAGVLLKHLLAMHQEVEGIRQGGDTEPIHRIRVASRRFRTALDLFAGSLPKKRLPGWLKAIRRVTRTLGPARDLDVQLITLEKTLAELPDKRLRPGVLRIVLRLRQKRTDLQIDVLRTLDEFTTSKPLQDLQQWLQENSVPPDTLPATLELYQLSQTAIQSGVDHLFAFESFILDPANVTELHAMRIAAKHLRYTLEIFAPLYADALKTYLTTLRSVQEQLGDIHDNDVWKQFMTQFLVDERARVVSYFGISTPLNFLNPGLHYFLTARENLRQQQHQAFIGDWQRLNNEDIWQNLNQTIQKPIIERHSIYPIAAPSQ